MAAGQSIANEVFPQNMTNVHMRFAALLRNSDKILSRLSDRYAGICLHYKITT